MAEDHLKWLRGPLPPLADSIVESGLVNESGNQTTTSQLPQQTLTQSPASIQKSKSKTSKMTSFQENKSKKDKVKSTIPSTLTIPAPEVPQNYKPPSIEKIHDQTRSKSSLTRPPIIGEPKKHNLRSEILQIMHSLDSAITDLTPVAPSFSPSEHAEFLSKMLQIYNFHLNQLILQEKDNSSDYALLLRRFQQFYNQIIADIPSLQKKFDEQVNSMTQNINVLKENLDGEIFTRKKLELKVSEKDHIISELKEKLSQITQESNEKDIKIQTISDDFDLQRAKITQLSFQTTTLTEEIESLKKAIKQRDDEIQRQMAANEDYMRQMSHFQEGDGGYIKVYHEEMQKREKAEMKIQDLQQQIHDLMNISKESIAVDTSDLQSSKNLKRKKGKTDPNLASAELSTSALPTSRIASAKNSRSDLSKEMLISTVSIETQTEGIESKQAEPDAPCDAGTGFAEHETQTEESSFSAQQAVEDQESKDNNSDENVHIHSIENETFIDEPSEESLKMIPDLFTTLTPFLSLQFSASEPQDLKIVNIAECVHGHNEKPLIWGLQLIHNFFTDPFLRSIQNSSVSSTEELFVNWISQQYKLQHLVNSVVSDFTYLTLTYFEDKMVSFFGEILQNKFTFPQVCFISTIYAFSISITKPSYLQMLQDMQPDTSQLKIHIRYAFELIAKSFNRKIANQYLIDQINIENPYLDYFDFLRQAADIFGENHKLLHSQASSLMKVCGCVDLGNISQELFNSFFSFLGFINLKELKSDWKFISNGESTTIQKVVFLCANKKKPLMELLALNNFSATYKKFSELSLSLGKLFESFITKFTKTLPSILKDASNEIVDKTQENRNEVKFALIDVNFPRILWSYKQLMMAIDQISLNEKGCIPIAEKPTDEMVDNLIEYFNRAESVAFAFLNI